MKILTTIIRSLEVVGKTLTSPNHLKCEFNSHFGRFGLVKEATKTIIWVQNGKETEYHQAFEVSVLELSRFYCTCIIYREYYPTLHILGTGSLELCV